MELRIVHTTRARTTRKSSSYAFSAEGSGVATQFYETIHKTVSLVSLSTAWRKAMTSSQARLRETDE